MRIDIASIRRKEALIIDTVLVPSGGGAEDVTRYAYEPSLVLAGIPGILE